jgi:hypothetical protein
MLNYTFLEHVQWDLSLCKRSCLTYCVLWQAVKHTCDLTYPFDWDVFFLSYTLFLLFILSTSFVSLASGLCISFSVSISLCLSVSGYHLYQGVCNYIYMTHNIMKHSLNHSRARLPSTSPSWSVCVCVGVWYVLWCTYIYILSLSLSLWLSLHLSLFHCNLYVLFPLFCAISDTSVPSNSVQFTRPCCDTAN